MPNRIIKESINESEGLADCSVFAIDLYKRLINYADDYGRFNADTMIMRARLYPREYDSVTEKDLVDGLSELAGVGKIQFYTPKIFNQGGKKGVYGVFPRWNDHQRIRETKAKTPDPGDTTINDWYLRRFVPIDLKARILERDNFKCQLCGKFVTSCRDAKRFVKLGSGLYHIDHIVPVVQGGRATYENLRVTCPECNMKRKKVFSFHEILDETTGQSVANCGELRQSAASCGNLRLESESNPNPNPNPSIPSDDGMCAAAVLNESFAAVIDAWNTLPAGIAKVSKVARDSQRGKKLAKRIRDYSLDTVLSAIDKIRESPFLQGENKKGWVVTFDWFVSPENFPKVLEGNYADRQPKNETDRFKNALLEWMGDDDVGQ